MAKSSSLTKESVSTPKKRKGVHAKSKNSSIKTSKNYRKKYRGQGR